MILLPYVQLDGVYTVPDEVIVSVFYKMVSDKTAEIVFYEGTIRSPEDFLKTLKSPSVLPVFVLVEGKLQAVAWINDLKFNHATAHFCVFREAWGKYSRDMGREVLRYWFSFKKDEGSPLFDLILGVTPAEYKFALKFVSDLGFKIVGEVPKVLYNAYKQKSSNAVLSYCERFQ